MEEWVRRVAAATGLNAADARKAITIMLGFIKREAPGRETEAVLAKIPGAPAMAARGDDIGAIFGGGLMAPFNELLAAGLGQSQIKGVARALIAFAEEKAGRSAVERVLRRVSGLPQFVEA